jgi:hypothetical protein
VENTRFLKIIKNTRGALSADFIFSMVLGISMCLVLFIMASTFALVEVGQYIAFSSARALIAGNFSPGNGCSGGGGQIKDQANMACEKFKSLSTHPFISKILNNPWFELKKDSDFLMLGLTANELYLDYQDDPSKIDRVVQTGVRLNFNPKVLQDLQVSLISPPAENIQGAKGFAKITGLLVREPTIEECAKFMKNRYAAIQLIDPRFAKQNTVDPFLNSVSISPPDIYSLQTMIGEDNGC